VLGAGAFCPQTAINDVEYLIFYRPLAIGKRCLSPHILNALPFVNIVHVFILLDIVIMWKFFKDILDYDQLVEECFANTTLSKGNLHGLLFIS
jgi:hypothetical protein